MQRSDFTLMAPVGSDASLAAALDAGADAVYFGVQGLNMRSRSSANFSLDDLRRIAATCAARGVESYLTLNTIVYDGELPRVREVVEAARQAGVTAVIAADMAVIMACREAGVPVHVSTQVNVSNIEAVRFYAQMADVMVLARELSLDRVKAIHDAIVSEGITGPGGRPVRLEMFCHGALCMAVSGKCYMSLHEMNMSANRGSCGQVCRRSYRVTDLESGAELEVDNKYIMSPKDLKTIHFLDRMVDAGVTVFKIEGRARGPEYVKATVECYDAALRAIADGRGLTAEAVSGWDEQLSRVFNRGFWDGYYLGQRLGEWSGKYGSSATRVKHYCALCTRWYPRLGVGEFRMEAGELRPGDELLVIGPQTGALTFEAGELRLERDPEPVVVKGQTFSVACPARVRPGDRLYRLDKTATSGANS